MWNYVGKGRPDFAKNPGPGEESVWDYPRPPACVADNRIVEVIFDGNTIAKTSRAIRVIETASPPTFYIPREDVKLEALVKKITGSYCEWKGGATYWDLANPNLKNVAWSYQDPSPGFEVIANYLSFYPGKLRCSVDGEAVRAQPGGFYGGWVTDEIVGPFKGEPGTSAW